MAEETKPPGTTGQAAPPPVASANPARTDSGYSAPAATVATVEKFGGNPGGRPRKDGLKPGSQEALAVDREKARVRQQNHRARVAASNPPVLPANLPPGPGAPAPQAPGVAALPPGESVQVVAPWQPDLLRPLFEELVPEVEAEMVASNTTKAAEARLPAALIKEVEKDSRWSQTAKKAVIVSSPPVAAKLLGLMGISPENQNEVVLVGALLSIWRGHARVARRLDTLIAERNGTARPGSGPSVSVTGPGVPLSVPPPPPGAPPVIS